MRLLNTKTGKFILVEHPRTAHYATLSHVWSRQDSPDYVPEQTYQDVCRIIEEHSDPVNPSLAGEPPSSAGHPVSGSVGATPSSTTVDSILPYLSDKIRRFCEVASADGFDLAWVDTCCIDKTNPAELDEAIASMYDWYSYAKACYVFLSDVSSHATPPGSRLRSGGHWETEFRQSQWFLRAWTLQELLAPNVVIFFSKDWQVLGSKHTLASLVEDITSIEAAIIKCKKSLNDVSVARRMAWAAPRKAAREEDRAYSLLGIFGVKIRVVYGEGSYSFYRLQEAIIEEIPDQTIFAWQLCPPQNNLLPGTFSRTSDARRCSPTPSTSLSSSANTTKRLPKPPVDAVYDPRQYLLANSPDDFANSSDLTPLSREELVESLPGILPADAIQTFKPTVHGISARLPLVQFTPASGASDSASYLALLACKFGESSKALVALLLRPHDDVPSVQASQYIVGTTLDEVPPTPSDCLLSPAPIAPSYVRATVLTPEQATKFRNTFIHVDIFIASRPSRAQYKQEHDLPLYRDIHATADTFRITACGWSSRLLTQQGYTMSFPPIHGLVTLNPGVFLEDIATRFVIIQQGVAAGGPSLDVQIGRLCTNDAQGLGVAVTCGSNMDLADGYSDFTRKYHSHISSWACQGGAATKELNLVSLRGTELTLRLVFTQESSGDSPRGTTVGNTGSSYRLGAEIFDILEEPESHQLGDPASSHGRNAHHAPQMTRGNNPWHIHSLPMSPLVRSPSSPSR